MTDVGTYEIRESHRRICSPDMTCADHNVCHLYFCNIFAQFIIKNDGFKNIFFTFCLVAIGNGSPLHSVYALSFLIFKETAQHLYIYIYIYIYIFVSYLKHGCSIGILHYMINGIY